jgi:adenosylhomocysteine nucleosidase
MKESGKSPAPILVCFAVKQEASSVPVPKKSDGWKIMITGMGRKNAADSLRRALDTERPRLVITSGFAGGLNPAFKTKTIIFEADPETGLAARLSKLGAKPARFHCAERVAATVAEKKSLREATGADAVEMESAAIREICREQKIPSATIRVISDDAQQDLPLDFNALMTADFQINYLKLAGKLIRHPGKLRELLRFQKQLESCASELWDVMYDLLVDGGI